MRFDLPPVTRALIIANVAIYLLQLLTGELLTVYFALWPLGPDQVAGYSDGTPVVVGFRAWQLITYGFLHGNLLHLAFNMLALYMFGVPLERKVGARPYLLYYGVAVVSAALLQLGVQLFEHAFYPTVGASGGVYGLILATGMLMPYAIIIGYPLMIPMPAWMAAVAYGVTELFLGITGTKSGVAHFAHLGGMLGGYVLIQYWRGRLPIKPRRRLS